MEKSIKESLLNKLGPSWGNLINSPLAGELFRFACKVIEVNKELLQVSTNPTTIEELVGLCNLLGKPLDYVQPAEVVVRVKEPIKALPGHIKLQSGSAEFTNIHQINDLTCFRLVSGKFATLNDNLESVTSSDSDTSVFINNTIISTINSKVNGLSTVGFKVEYSEDLSWFNLSDVKEISTTTLWVDDLKVNHEIISFIPYNKFSRDVIKRSYLLRTFPSIIDAINRLIYPYGVVASDSKLGDLVILTDYNKNQLVHDLLSSYDITFRIVNPTLLEYTLSPKGFQLNSEHVKFVESLIKDLLSNNRKVCPRDFIYIELRFQEKYGMNIQVNIQNKTIGYYKYERFDSSC